MLGHYLVSLGATYSRKSKRRSDMAINSPQANKERMFHVHMLVNSLSIVVQKSISLRYFKLSLVLNFPKFQAGDLIKLFL